MTPPSTQPVTMATLTAPALCPVRGAPHLAAGAWHRELSHVTEDANSTLDPTAAHGVPLP